MKKILVIAVLCLFAVDARRARSQVEQSIDPALDISTLQLWPSGAPEVVGTDPADLPTLTVFLPQKGKGTGSAVIVAPGGSYLGLASNLEGRQVADWFTSKGVTAFVLKYRLGAKYLYPIPLQDAQRAVRLVRSSASAYGFLPDRIGFVGFSAGGHLAAATGTLFDAGKPDATDPIERMSSRPDFLVLGYPWLNAMQPSGHYISYCSVIKTIPAETCKDDEQKYTPSLHVTSQTPTTFIYSTSDDRTVPISASVVFYNALLTAGVPAELHIFRHGDHGSGMGAGIAALDLWPVLLEQWLRDQGFLTPIPKG
ncbi:MAG TPA: alpha/beta hydrolase [Acidobacteriaceae bacterium]|nr:alpha/beta hydrolase [Acidobacteriaceae bacterium]